MLPRATLLAWLNPLLSSCYPQRTPSSRPPSSSSSQLFFLLSVFSGTPSCYILSCFARKQSITDSFRCVCVLRNSSSPQIGSEVSSVIPSRRARPSRIQCLATFGLFLYFPCGSFLNSEVINSAKNHRGVHTVCMCTCVSFCGSPYVYIHTSLLTSVPVYFMGNLWPYNVSF